MHQSAFKGNPHRSRRILFWWHLFSVNVFDDSSHKLPPHHYYVLIILTSCLFVCFFMSLEIETEFVERYYTAVGVSEKNIRVMACALVNPIRSSKKKVFDPFRGISLVLKKKKKQTKKKTADCFSLSIRCTSTVTGAFSFSCWVVRKGGLTNLEVWQETPRHEGWSQPARISEGVKILVAAFPFFFLFFFFCFLWLVYTSFQREWFASLWMSKEIESQNVPTE